MITKPGLKIPRFVVGVDGGGTKTVALAGDLDGLILGRGESGSSNYHNVGAEEASRAIRQAVLEAQKWAGLGKTKAEIAVVALAGVDSRRDRVKAEHFVNAANIARKSLVVHDSTAALQAATHGGPGIIVISGTGCVAAGINRAGKRSRVGGWGCLIDDEGSAYDIGRKALMSTFRALDGRFPRTRLGRALRRKFHVRRLEDALGTIYSEEFGVEGIAAIAPIVAKAASRDTVSRKILNSAGVSLAGLACTVAKRLKMEHERFEIALVGGTFAAGKHLVGPLRRKVRAECPHADIRVLKSEPAKGALLLAISEIQRN